MANDPKQRPTPRPRRRRTDIDPNTPTPKVANERRRRKSSTPAADAPVEPVETLAASAAPVDPDPASDGGPPPSSVPADAAPTRVFHLPGGVSLRQAVGRRGPRGRDDRR